MDAADALDEIASLLERELASSYKSKAYRRAAEIVRGIPADELAARITDGRLRRTAGIGDSTYKVIVDAAAGGVPEKLVTLREEAGVARRTGLVAELKGDLHSHSEWSDGTTSIQAMARGAAAVGLEWFVLSDHSPSLRVANGLSAERLAEQLEIVEALNADGGLGIRILPGIEVDILESGSLDQTPEMLERLDVVVASVHSKLRAPEPDMTKRMLRAIADPHTNVLGHCTGRLVKGSRGTRPQSAFDAAAVFAACAEHDVAVEINSRPERQDPPDELIAQAFEAGCLFSIDSDAHAPGHFAFLELGAARAERAGIPADRIVTTWDVDRLRAWSHRKR
jgi:putative hydrolase